MIFLSIFSWVMAVGEPAVHLPGCSCIFARFPIAPDQSNNPKNPEKNWGPVWDSNIPGFFVKPGFRLWAN